MCHDILVDLPSVRAMVRGKHTPKITFCSVLAVWRENFPKLGPNRSRHLSWGVGTSLCKPHRYVLAQRVWFFGRLKTGIHFAPFLSFQFQMNKNETEEYANSTAFKELFCLRFSLSKTSNDDTISALRPGLKKLKGEGF